MDWHSFGMMRLNCWILLNFLGLLLSFQASSSGVYGKIFNDAESSFSSFESPDHSFTLKYPNDWDIIKSLTWTDRNVSSVAFGPSFAGIGSDHKEMVEILKVKGLPTAYSVNNLVDDYMKYLRKIFGRTFFVTDLGTENISSLHGRTFLVSITSYYPLDSSQIFVVHNHDAYIIGYFEGIYYQKYFLQARNLIKSIELKDAIQ